MQKDSARKTALKILTRVDAEDSFADILLSKTLEKSTLQQIDKSLATELVYGVLRWKLKIDWIINQFSKIKTKKMEHDVLNAIRLGVYQLLFLTKIPPSAAINESVELVMKNGSKRGGFTNAVLRRVDAERDAVIFPDIEIEPIKHISIVHSHPEYLIERWVKRYGIEETIRLCTANNQIPQTVLRVNALKTIRDELIKKLLENGMDAEKTKYSRDGIMVRNSLYPSIEKIDQQLFYIQDEASQMVAYLLSPQQGENILDACSAPGGKATHIAQLMGDKGTVYATDVHASRLKSIISTCKRLVINSVKIYLADAAGDIQFAPEGGFDAVLIDAPCSGLGVLRRNPDARWKKPDIKELSLLQGKILNNLARYVKVGGRLVYSTCTTEPEENEEVIYGFLKTHPEFKIEDAKRFLPEDIVDEMGFLRTYPHKHNIDGFFAARLKMQE
ncbi:MAG: 16S rRNA (cytosine(967)-C(5))-methyltransferase [Deltaproteobacteria bacterium GWC2_42_11]|nr:MAG: 16S rRNA (cytosine(967)-C(5))-methyltransferase [Deltaproteobacteria bacterium GWC2_42_11]HBO84583.1 16S rRNA (cytosine(967)-C(5))-methyltransferase RsmB [Deltaproteobacteria bacterium]